MGGRPGGRPLALERAARGGRPLALKTARPPPMTGAMSLPAILERIAQIDQIISPKPPVDRGWLRLPVF